MQPFTCLVKKEDNQYSSLCVELDVASCGDTNEEAIEGLQNAIQAYIEYMDSEGRENEIYRPVSMIELRKFLFSDEFKTEQSFNAVSLEVEYA